MVARARLELRLAAGSARAGRLHGAAAAPRRPFAAGRAGLSGAAQRELPVLDVRAVRGARAGVGRPPHGPCGAAGRGVAAEPLARATAAGCAPAAAPPPNSP